MSKPGSSKSVCCGLVHPLVDRMTNAAVVGADDAEAWDVLEEAELGLALRDDALDVGPDPPLVLDPALLTGCGEGLAREARNDAIHDSTPRSSIEGAEVGPDRSLRKGPVLHARRQNRCGIRLDLDVADRASSSSEGKVQTEVEPSVSRAEGEHAELGTRHHTRSRLPGQDRRRTRLDLAHLIEGR